MPSPPFEMGNGNVTSVLDDSLRGMLSLSQARPDSLWSLSDVPV